MFLKPVLLIFSTELEEVVTVSPATVIYNSNKLNCFTNEKKS